MFPIMGNNESKLPVAGNELQRGKHKKDYLETTLPTILVTFTNLYCQ